MKFQIKNIINHLKLEIINWKLEILRKAERGQSLITLLFFTVIGITVITAAALIVTTSILASSNAERGLKAYYAAESGAEDALLRLLRNPTLDVSTPYTVSSDDGDASVTIQTTSNGGTITSIITSTGTNGTTTRRIQVTTGYTNGQRAITSWNEIQ